MRIGVDVMGGDHAPHAILDGALASLDRLGPDDRVVLVGDEKIIRAAVEAAGSDDRVEIVPTTEVIGMDEAPAAAVRAKPDSSITKLAQLAGRKAKQRLDAIISAGNTGAKVAAAQMYIRRLPHVHRPGITVTLPTFSGPIVLIDVGANIEPKPPHLAQYGVMGSIFSERMLGVTNPRVGLMNVGAEEAKGTSEMKDAHEQLRAVKGLNYIGNIEGRGVFDGEADVVITDGVVGNVMLKLAEGLAKGIFKALGRELAVMDPELAARLQPIIKKLYASHDYHEYGGAPLLGIHGTAFICHGSSEARTITNAVVNAKRCVESGINEAIVERLGALKEALA